MEQETEGQDRPDTDDHHDDPGDPGQARYGTGDHRVYSLGCAGPAGHIGRQLCGIICKSV